METPNEKLYNFLKEKGVIKYPGSYEKWGNRGKECKEVGSQENRSEIPGWTKLLTDKERTQFETMFGKI